MLKNTGKQDHKPKLALKIVALAKPVGNNDIRLLLSNKKSSCFSARRMSI
ncbi:hypothetical protein CRENPOLYSF1_930001 [Crenothrix polyspora]|uniref:Uncharacterized protein n=1 Tax=Crenothrix polyspora TaxID=360316 RepID=A0A1R4HJZ8_9GAMM|nr:hypothetical protein CRENPOLYSF1_930001 [Crenothrix polyspora]